MNLLSIIEYFMKQHTVISSGVIIFLLLQLIEITPIKVSPWKALKHSVSDFFISGIKVDIKNLSNEIKKMDDKLEEHISESKQKNIRDRRSLILRSAAAISNGQQYNEEHLRFLVNECDAYKAYCTKHNIHNGVAKANIEIIYKTYRDYISKKLNS